MIAARHFEHYFAEHPNRGFSEYALELIVAGIQGVRIGEQQEQATDVMDERDFDTLLDGF